MLDRNILLSALLLGPPSVALCQAEPPSSGWFAIRVVDAGTGRGVPLVELKTVNHLRYYTDSNGWVAFREPGLMNRQLFFHVRSHGYEYPKDGFGYRGKRLSTAPGTEAVLKLKRLNIAERLYRVTGGGIYRDSHLLGRVSYTGKAGADSLGPSHQFHLLYSSSGVQLGPWSVLHDDGDGYRRLANEPSLAANLTQCG